MPLTQMSIKFKVALAVSLVLGVCFSLFFTLNYRDTVQRIRTHAEQLITVNHQLHATYVQETLVAMTQDSETIVGFPPISGIFRSLAAADQVDPLDGSTLDDWRGRLETLFASLIKSRGTYSQIRLLLPQNNWREFVRVDRNQDEVRIVPRSALQPKGQEPYIRRLIAPPPQDFQFSNVTRNREFGRVAGPPTLRSMKRIEAADGTLLGAIVLNSHISELLTRPRPPNQIGHVYYAIENTASPIAEIVTADLTFLSHSEGAPDFPNWMQVADLPAGHLIADGHGQGHFVTEVRAATSDKPFSIKIISKLDMQPLFAEAWTELRRDLRNATLLTILASCLAYAFTARLHAPLEQLLGEIKSSSQTLQPLSRDFSGGDEVSVLAQNFTQLINSLIRETQRLDMILKNAAEGVLTLHSDGRIEDANPKAQSIFGRAAGDLLGRNLIDLLENEDQVSLATLEEARNQAGREPLRREVRLTRQDGTDLTVQVAFQHAHHSDGQRFIVMLRDITARVAAMRQSEALINALKKSNAELDQFAYVASHDLKAPLRVISNAVSWLEEDLEPYLNDDTRESMNLLHSRAKRMEVLLNDLLQHSRIGRVASPETRVSGSTMAKGLLQLLEIPDGIEIQFSDRFLESHMRQLPLEIILVNLIGNSIKHHDKAVGHISVDVVNQDDFLTFRVEDDGPGIEPAYHERIFEVFQTLQSRDQLESSGMGLAFVKKHIDVAGGSISVMSDGTRGTVFEFRWPKDLGQQERAA
ncbi:sensor histidine kinase [Tritonibacter horizontis]|uniref:histidine kinase n=1 Tax=Tritonibacter horizontis TaxID=1768241 RepID=A0A132BVQ8_9RHOB|nr:ATP-binding protein [Tritonibacter horizontis]KUP91907.1 phytochrome-like protein cph1 [Tritonibacter horizontis]